MGEHRSAQHEGTPVIGSVLADTSIWVAHFRSANSTLQRLAADDRLLIHPLVVLELACGTPPAPRARTLLQLRTLRSAVTATFEETLALIERQRLYDCGCGAVDLSLLASTLLTPQSVLWTRDTDLHALADHLQVAFNGAPH